MPRRRHGRRLPGQEARLGPPPSLPPSRPADPLPRYYSNALLDGIHRSVAIEEWHRLRLDHDSLDTQVAGVRLERALGAFDMFVLHDQFGDLDDVCLATPIGGAVPTQR